MSIRARNADLNKIARLYCARWADEYAAVDFRRVGAAARNRLFAVVAVD